METMYDLVRLTTNDLSRADVITDSLLISDKFNKRHDLVLRAIDNLKNDLHKNEEIDKSVYLLEESTYLNNGRTYRMYEMNRAFFTLLVMGFNGSKALAFKTEYIKQFDFMEHELIARGETRHIGIGVRKDMTKAILDYVPSEGNFKKFAISNYTGLVYKKVLGTTLKKWKEQNNIPKGEKNRNFLTKEQLEKVQYYESKIADIIQVTSDLIDPKELYQKIKDFINK